MDLREIGLGGCGLDSTVSGQGPVAGCCEWSDEPSGSCATELVKKLHFYETQVFIAVFTKACHWTLKHAAYYRVPYMTGVLLYCFCTLSPTQLLILSINIPEFDKKHK
jgi:hypothetical protein